MNWFEQTYQPLREYKINVLTTPHINITYSNCAYANVNITLVSESILLLNPHVVRILNYTI